MEKLPYTIAVFSDAHLDMMHDVPQRIERMLEECRQLNVDCIWQLGDFMYPNEAYLQSREPESIPRLHKAHYYAGRDDETQAVREMIQHCGIPFYHVLGNHDLDACSLDCILDFYGMEKPYYSVDAGGVRMIALDTNYVLTDGVYYHLGDASKPAYRPYGWLPQEQLNWLEEQLDCDLPCILFSHMTLGANVLPLGNMKNVKTLIRKANVPLCVNGHAHGDMRYREDGVVYWSIAGLSNLWLGPQYARTRYSKAISALCPHLSEAVPYRDPLFAIVEITDQEIRILRRETAFVGDGPQVVGVPENHFTWPIQPVIEPEVISLRKV